MIKDCKVLGIVAEYNPFHNGHAYHIQQAKAKSGADYVVAVISGNFVQRGNTSVVNKWKKTEMALSCGVDMIIELPTIYSVSSAENFAMGAVKILESLKFVDAISFGVETEDFGALNNIAGVLAEEPKQYKSFLSSELKKGLSFPKARANALMLYLNDNKRYCDILEGSNNILAIEYLKALKKIKSTIQPVPVQRGKVYYNDNQIVDDFASATAIRKMIKNSQFSDIRKVVPFSSYRLLRQEGDLENIVSDMEKYGSQIIYALRKMTVAQIAELPDVTEGLEHVIKNSANYTNNIQELINVVKTKRYTQTRIQRILLCALLGITKKDMEAVKKIDSYVRILGVNEKGKVLISEISTVNSKLSVITSVKKFEDVNQNKVYRRMLDIDKFATDVYTMACKSDCLANLDYTKSMIVM